MVLSDRAKIKAYEEQRRLELIANPPRPHRADHDSVVLFERRRRTWNRAMEQIFGENHGREKTHIAMILEGWGLPDCSADRNVARLTSWTHNWAKDGGLSVKEVIRAGLGLKMPRAAIASTLLRLRAQRDVEERGGPLKRTRHPYEIGRGLIAERALNIDRLLMNRRGPFDPEP